MNSTKALIFLIGLFSVSLFTSCDNEDVLNTPDGKIQYFVSQYFPGIGIDSKSTLADGDIQVVLKKSATLLFDKNGSWISVDGNGVTLPAVMLYDQLPDILYNYIVESEDTEGVYRIFRNSEIYVVNFIDSSVQYEIASGKISYITDGGDI